MTKDNILEEKKVVNKIDLHAELIETGVEQVLIDLDKSLIGLEPVKTRIRETAALLLVEKAREKLGLAHETPTLHMSFSGNPGTGKTKTARMWVYVNDGRPRGSSSPVAAGYYYSPDRKGERPQEHLKNFTGILHADSYSGYNKLYVSEDNPDASVEEAACWAHTRRKFYDIAAYNEKANIAFAQDF